MLCSVYVNIEFLFFIHGFGENRIFNEGSLNGGSQMEKKAELHCECEVRGYVEIILFIKHLPMY